MRDRHRHGGRRSGDADGGRKVRINGANARSADELLEWLRVIWLTPAMDALFTGPAGDRRRFLDRLVLAIDPGHGQRALDYEKAMRGRNRLLVRGRARRAGSTPSRRRWPKPAWRSPRRGWNWCGCCAP
jgi:recombinational DNA repair ATPase RecF